jgi:hypothetical protein
MTTITSKGEFVIVWITICNAFEVVENYLTDEVLFRYPKLYIPNNYTFLCTTDTITEEIAKEIVDENKVGYINYLFGNNHIGQNVNHHHRSFQVALRSFNSLLQSQNLSPLKTYAICKKN